MDQKAMQQMKKGLESVKDEPRSFGFSPNEGEPVLLVKKTAISPSVFSSAVESKLGVPFKGGSIYLGEVRRTGGSWHFVVDPGASKGQLSESKARKALRELAALIGVAKLRSATVTIGTSEPPVLFGPLLLGPLERLEVLLGGAPHSEEQRAEIRTLQKPFQALRDSVKRDLDAYDALPREQQELFAAAAEQRTQALQRIRAIRERVKQLRAPETDPVQSRTQPPPPPRLAVADDARGVSKRVDAQLLQYEAWASENTDPAAHRQQLLALKEALLQSQRDSQSGFAGRFKKLLRREKLEKLDQLRQSIEDKLRQLDDHILEREVQGSIDAGFFRTTAENNASGGMSGSYFIGDEKRPRAYIFKPMHQEFIQSGQQAGQGLRGEVLAGFLQDKVQELTGLDLGIPQTRAATLEHPTLSDVGARLRSVDSDNRDLYSPQAPSPRQLGALIKGIEDVTGDLSSWEPRDISPERLGRQAGRVALACILTGQLDHRNPDNILVTGTGEETSLRPIDFGYSRPTMNELMINMDGINNTKMGEGMNSPWAAWDAQPWAQLPMPPEDVEALCSLDEYALTIATAGEADRLRELDQSLPALNDSQLMAQLTMTRAVRLLAEAVVARGLRLSACDLSDLFCSRQQGEKSPYMQYADRILERRQQREPPITQDDYNTIFNDVFPGYLAAWLEARAERMQPS